MTSVKPRPPNGPGSNGLRGGQNSFPNGKTAIGGWMDEVGGPQGYKRGFTTLDFETEAQHQQFGATLRRSPFYGSPLPESVYEATPSVADNFNNPRIKRDYDPFSTTQHEALKSCEGALQEERILKNEPPLSNMQGEALMKYRHQWTIDSELAREIRYVTETRRASTKQPPQFQVPSIRLLPGTPKALELFRERLLIKYGITGLPSLRHCVGTGKMPCEILLNAIKKIEIEVSKYEFHQMIAFFTADTTIDLGQFVETVVARTAGFDRPACEALYKKLFADPTITLGELFFRLRKDIFPEVAEGLTIFADTYGAHNSNGDVLIDMEGFILLHSDMYASAPYSYEKIIPFLWE
jgi:hypothetical protein